MKTQRLARTARTLSWIATALGLLQGCSGFVESTDGAGGVGGTGGSTNSTTTSATATTTSATATTTTTTSATVTTTTTTPICDPEPCPTPAFWMNDADYELNTGGMWTEGTPEHLLWGSGPPSQYPSCDYPVGDLMLCYHEILEIRIPTDLLVPGTISLATQGVELHYFYGDNGGGGEELCFFHNDILSTEGQIIIEAVDDQSVIFQVTGSDPSWPSIATGIFTAARCL